MTRLGTEDCDETIEQGQNKCREKAELNCGSAGKEEHNGTNFLTIHSACHISLNPSPLIVMHGQCGCFEYDN